MDVSAADVQPMVFPIFAAVPREAVAGSIPVTIVNGSHDRFPGAYQNVDMVSMMFNMQTQLQTQEMRIQNLEKESAHQQRQLNVIRQGDPPPKCPTCHQSRSLKILFCGHLMCDSCIGDLASNQCPYMHDDNGFVQNPNTRSPCKALRR